MKDAFGRELEIGQRVAHVSSGCSTVYKFDGWVTGFTPKMVRFSNQQHGRGGAVSSGNLIILSEEGL